MKRPAAEKALSDSIDVGGMVISALNKLSKLLLRFPVASKILISFDILLTSYDISSGFSALVIFKMAASNIWWSVKSDVVKIFVFFIHKVSAPSSYLSNSSILDEEPASLSATNNLENNILAVAFNSGFDGSNNMESMLNSYS